VRELERRIGEADRLLNVERHLDTLCRDIQRPLESLAVKSQQLLSAYRDLGVESCLETISAKTQEAVRVARQILQASERRVAEQVGFSLTEAIEAALADLLPSAETSRVTIERNLATDLPLAAGSMEAFRSVMRLVLAQALRIVALSTRAHRLTVSTRYIAPAAPPPDTSTLFPLTPPSYVEAEFVEGDLPAREAQAGQVQTITFGADLFQAFHVVEEAGGLLDLAVTPQQPLLIRFRLPTTISWALAPPTRAEAAPVSPPRPVEALPQAAPVMPAPPAYPDRRRHHRVSCAITIHIRVGTELWEGSTLNLGLGGIAMMFPTPFPPAEGRACFLVIHTMAGSLDIQGTVRRCITTLVSGEGRSGSLVAMEFSELPRTTRLVMQSLLDEISTKTMTVTIEGSIVGGVPSRLDAGRIAGVEEDSLDIRWDIRLCTTLPVRIIPEGAVTATPSLGLTVNLSRNGLSMQVKARPDAIPPNVDVQISSSSTVATPIPEEQLPLDWTITGQVVWMAVDPEAPSELRPSPLEPGLRLGLRFTKVPFAAERALDQLIHRLLESGTEPLSAQDSGEIVSTTLQHRAADGTSIPMVEDRHRDATDPKIPLIVISSGFAATKGDYLGLSYLLAANGFRVLRYDSLDHVGEGAGEVHRAALGRMADDLRTVISYARRTWGQARIALVAFDLSARCALKIAGQDASTDLLILCNPIYDLRAELRLVHGHDLVGDYDLGVRRGIGNLFGMNVNLDQFLQDAVDARFVDLESSLRDVEQLRAPLVHLEFPINVPLRPEMSPPQSDNVDRVLASAPIGSQRATVQSSAPFSLDTLAPSSALAQAILAQCRQLLGGVVVQDTPVRPRRSAIARQRRLEHLRIRARKSATFPDPQTLWLSYLQHMQQLANLTDYWTLFDRLHHCLLEADRPMKLLEVGCGRGELCRSLLVNRLYRQLHGGGPPQLLLQHLGIEVSVEILQLARLNSLAVDKELEARFSKPQVLFPTVSSSWIQTAWHSPLPFKDETVQVIVCTLGLSFVRHPLWTLRDFWRVLQPKGQLLLTCLTPSSDLTRVYRKALRTSNQDEFQEIHHVCLQSLGRMNQALREGLLTGFDAAGLASLTSTLRGSLRALVPVLDDQALLAIVEKPESSG
jgi:SAM-dependent methyltransferase